MDLIIYYRVMAILAEMGQKWPVSLIDDFDPEFSIKNFGPHRLYDFHIELRNDVDQRDFALDFCDAMDAHNKITAVKADFVAMDVYPGPVPNWSTVYLTVSAI